MGTIPAAIIGLGRIASLLEDDPLREKPCTHAGALVASGRCAITGGMDREADRRRSFSRRWNTPAFDDARAMVRAVKPQILVIASDPESHTRYVRLAVRESVPVVICEKPLAHNLLSARRIVRLERSGKSRVVVNHERRFSRDYRLVRDAVMREQFGELLSVRGILYFGKTARHDQVLLHDGTHLIDAIHYVCDDRIGVTRRVGNVRSSDSTVYVHGTLKGRSIPVVLEVGAGRDYLHLETELTFSAGRIRVGNGIFSWERSEKSPYYTGYRSLAPQPRIVPSPTGYFSGMVQEAIRLVDDPRGRSRSSAADAWEALRVVDRACGGMSSLVLR